MSQSMDETENKTRNIIYACLAGFSLFAIAIGVTRFSYAPIVPFLVNNHWVTNPQAGYVGGANFFGYFVGVCFAHQLTRLVAINKVMTTMIIITVIASLLCVVNVGFFWLSFWRFIVGVTAGVIMVLAPSIVLCGMDGEQKSLISGIIFTGIGIGSAVSSLLVPFFYSRGGVAGIWMGVAIIVLLLGAIAYPKCGTIINIHNKKNPQHFKLSKRQRAGFWFAFAGYFFAAFGLTPSILFLSDYAHRLLGANLSLSSILFALFGVGCTVGSFVAGVLCKKVGTYWSIISTSLVGILGLTVIVFSHSLIAVGVDAFASGFYLVALVVLMSLLVSDLVSIEYHAKYWAYLTLAYAAAQFVAGYAFSFALHLHFTYVHIFEVGLMVLVMSLVSYLFLSKVSKVS